MFDPASVRFTGPLSPFVTGFWSELMRLGYAPLSAGNLLRLAAHTSRWLATKRLRPSDLTTESIAAFIAHRRRQGHTQFLSPAALGPLITYLRALGVTPPPAPAAIVSPLDALLRDYSDYLVRERGLIAMTVLAYCVFAREFLLMRPHADWSRLTPDQVTSFVLRDSRRLSASYCRHRVTLLRSLLRFLHVRGDLRHDLASCVPGIASWRLASLPRHLTPVEVDRLWASCNSSSSLDRRDTAIVRLLVRLGLRAGEVAALRLDEVDWRTGEVVIRGKGRRVSRLPLPTDVGRALATYLRRARPRSTTRQVFLDSRAPFQALTSAGVRSAATRVLRRAGLAQGGTHLLRHTAATQMLRGGASLPEIGHVLRHRRIDTTALYAKVDFNSLRLVAQPWPAGAR
jgi:integrase/recombinase XerD